MRGFVAEDFSGARVEQMRGPVNLGFGDAIEALAFRKILPEQAVGVLVEAAPP